MKMPKHFGKCRLCGKECVLTYEHVPPRNAFNSHTVIEYSFEDTIKTLTDNDRMPWDHSGLKGKQNQKGSGGYYLCRECNNNTGSWYMEEYVLFAKTLASMIYTEEFKEREIYDFTLFDLSPLKLYKAVITLMCDTNHDGLGDEQIKAFIMNKESNDFDMEKYQIYAYLVAPGSMRVTGKAAEIITTVPHPIIFSEVSHYPVGFTMYIDKPMGFEPFGVNINSFVKCSYNEKCNISFHGMPYVSLNTHIPIDFRSKDEIKNCRVETEKRLQSMDKKSNG